MVAHPDWLDRTAYPFEHHVFESEDGKMHYVDEGSGRTLLLVHGTPTWSFLWRHLVRALSNTYRVVAPDHLGFGLSEKPANAPYRPADHARRLSALIDRLDLGEYVLGVHDFGGPIGLARAIEQPEEVRGLLLFNTWMWSKNEEWIPRWASRLFASRLGKWLYHDQNFSPRFLLPSLFGDRSALTASIHEHYLGPFARPQERTAPWMLARELTGSSDWYETLWHQRVRLVDRPALILWGLADSAFGEKDLGRWQSALPQAQVHPVEAAGHFVPEERPVQTEEAVRDFLEEIC